MTLPSFMMQLSHGTNWSLSLAIGAEKTLSVAGVLKDVRVMYIYNILKSRELWRGRVGSEYPAHDDKLSGFTM